MKYAQSLQVLSAARLNKYAHACGNNKAIRFFSIIIYFLKYNIQNPSITLFHCLYSIVLSYLLYLSTSLYILEKNSYIKN